MAKSSDKAGDDQAAPPAGRKNPAGLMLSLMIGILSAAFFALPTVLLFATGMVPTLVAWIVDRNRDSHTLMSVGSLNLAGLLPSLLALWTGGHSFRIATRIMSDPYTWLFAFGAAGVGWTLVLGLPKVVETAMTFRNEAEIARLKNRQAALVEEWGQEVAGKPAAME